MKEMIEEFKTEYSKKEKSFAVQPKLINKLISKLIQKHSTSIVKNKEWEVLSSVDIAQEEFNLLYMWKDFFDANIESTNSNKKTLENLIKRYDLNQVQVDLFKTDYNLNYKK